ncbi:MAG: beta-ketoacyl synthase N-terminal-like domain-containing protein [Verrucomicrobiota bacterium]
MTVDLTIAGRGAVTPAGIGLDALLHGKPAITRAEELRRPGRSWPVLRVNLKDPAFARWQREPRLRRASPITFFLVEAAAQALAGLTAEECAATGLIVAYSAGCVAYSRRFYEGVVKQGQRAASPALFPETVFNSPASHVAAVLGLNGAAYALVGDESAWVSALLTAAVWLKQGRVRQMLVLGAEEFDPLVLDAYRSARWLREKDARGFLTAEGAAGLLVRAAGPGDETRITAARDGWIYRTRREAAQAAAALLRDVDGTAPIYRSAEHAWLAPLEAGQLRGRTVAPDLPYLGEAFTASAAWHSVRASTLVGAARPRLLVPVWGLNHQLALLELSHAK